MGEYRVEQVLGRGGFGTVYRAVQPLIGKPVAVKVLSREFSTNAEMVSRFVAEARAVNRIRHRNIVDIFSFGVLEDGRHYFVMELLEGTTLRDLLEERGSLEVPLAISILRDVARALDAAHAKGIAHRDLKPDNIFLVIDSDGGMSPKLIDFGIAKLMDPGRSAAHVTKTGAPMGTPQYMSPEQIRGMNVDQRTDIYSLGVVTHEILTGIPPFQADAVMALCLLHLNGEPPAASSVRKELPTALDAPLLHMLEKAPEARPETPTLAIDALARAAVDAGFLVPLPVIGFTPRSNPAPPSSDSQADRTRLGAATTAAAPSITPTARSGRSESRAPLYAIGALLFVLGGLLALIHGKQTNAAASAPDARASVALPASKPVAAPPSVTRQVAAPPAPVDEVPIEVHTRPVVADVYVDGENRGSSAQRLLLPRSNDKRTLTLKAEGYAPAEVEVVPSESRVVSVTLSKAAHRGSQKRTHSAELENPFK